MVGHRAAAVRNQEAQGGEVAEQIALQQLHESGGVGVQIMRAGGVEAVVAAGGNVNHGGDVVFHHFFVNRIPIFIGQRRRSPMAAGRIGVEVDADVAVFVDTAFQLGNAGFDGYARALRQHRHRHEMLGKQL